MEPPDQRDAPVSLAGKGVVGSSVWVTTGGTDAAQRQPVEGALGVAQVVYHSLRGGSISLTAMRGFFLVGLAAGHSELIGAAMTRVCPTAEIVIRPGLDPGTVQLSDRSLVVLAAPPSVRRDALGAAHVLVIVEPNSGTGIEDAMGWGADDLLELPLVEVAVESTIRRTLARVRRGARCENQDVEHTRAEVDEKEHFLLALLDAIPNPVYYRDAAGRYMGCNTAFCGFLGLPQAAILGHHFSELWPPELCQQFLDHDRELIENPGRRLLEACLPAADGELRQMLVTKSVFRDVDGGLAGIVGVLTDVTDRKRAEDALAANEQRFRAFFDSPVVGFFRTAVPDGRVTDLNPTAARMLGYESPEAAKQDRASTVEHYDPARRTALVELLQTKGEVSDFEIHFVRRDGSALDLSVSGRLIEDGRSFEGLCVDITDRLDAERELGRARSLLWAALDQMPVAVAVVDRARPAASFANSTWRRLLSDAKPTWCDGRWSCFPPGWDVRDETGVDIDGEQLLLAQALGSSGSSLHNLELQVVSADGRKHFFLAGAAPVSDAEGGVSAGVIVVLDLTEEKELRARLARAEKMEALGQFAGGVAHDFNNLLTVILGGVQLLRTQHSSTAAQESELKSIDLAARSAADLTRRLLAFARQQVMQSEVLDLGRTVADNLEMLRRVLPSQIEVRTELDQSPLGVVADRGVVGQVIVNLILNARDSMPSGGTITVSTHPVSITGPPSEARPWAGPGTYAMIRVRDEGEGIPPETLAHVFDPFFTTKHADRGLGLGLASVYGAAKQLGGFVEVRSEVGRGSTFEFCLPHVETPAGRHSGEVAAVPSGGHERILLVEDEPSLADVLGRFLTCRGYEVQVVGNGVEALESLGSGGAHPDLVISDLGMPRMGGRELFLRARAADPRLRFLFCSGNVSDPRDHDFLRSSGARFLQKPFDLESLAAAVRRVLGASNGGR